VFELACCGDSKSVCVSSAPPHHDGQVIHVALAGNANVGKSVIFTQLTGVSQTIGNWPGKTVEKKEGCLFFSGYHFNIVDLPGIYSLSTYTLEEIVSRQYLISEEVDVIINVVDASNLERNLFFTFQLLELGVPLVLAVNQMDILRKRKIDLNLELMGLILKVPVIPVVAVHGRGVHELLEKIIEMKMTRTIQKHKHDNTVTDATHSSPFKTNSAIANSSSVLSLGKEVERCISTLVDLITNTEEVLVPCRYPARFISMKLLERDEEIVEIIKKSKQGEIIFEKANLLRKELEDLHGEDIVTIMSAEIYNKIHELVDGVINLKARGKRKATLSDILDHLTTHSVWGYVILGLILYGTYFITFTIGDLIGGLLDEAFGIWSEGVYAAYGNANPIVQVFWAGAMGGFIGAVGGVIVYVIPFFLIIELLQDSGYLPRAAFMLDRIMHILGVHGKAIIPMILGFGCNVPACAGCRIMESDREKKIAIALSSKIPCAAVLVVVMGLVGRYLGTGWVIFLFAVNFGVVIGIGRLLNKIMPGKCTELLMEMHEYRSPNISIVLKQSWVRTKEFLFKSIPLIIIIGVGLEILLLFQLLDPFNFLLSPVTVVWLGLPMITGVFLIYGILRKELSLVLLEVLATSMGIAMVDLLTPVQMLVFCLVMMLYVPCFATIVVMARESGWRYALKIALLEVAIALLLGGALNWIMNFAGIGIM